MSIKDYFRDTVVYDYYLLLRDRSKLYDWFLNGKDSSPPDIVKQLAVKNLSGENKIDTLVETGSYIGDMIYANKNYFKRIISIEVSEKFYNHTKKRFESYKHITIIKGDSSNVLEGILKEIKKPVVFWLDGHHSSMGPLLTQKHTPILQELTIILKHPIKNHLILIDDANCFDGTNDYPTIYELKKFINQLRKNYNFCIEDNIIRIYYDN